MTGTYVLNVCFEIFLTDFRKGRECLLITQLKLVSLKYLFAILQEMIPATAHSIIIVLHLIYN